MRLRSAVAVTAAVFTAVLGLPAPAALADTPAADTLYVSRASSCSDTGTGTQAVPYCTIGAAARVVEPGQTVRIGPGVYSEDVQLRRSGMPGRPVRFVGESDSHPLGDSNTRLRSTGTAFTLNGVHDVEIRELTVQGKAAAVAVVDSTAVVVDRLRVASGSASTTAVAVSGSSSDVRVSRNRLLYGSGIVVGAGARQVVVTTNEVSSSAADGITVTDAPGTVVTSNTVIGAVGSGIALRGSSAGSAVFNNVLDGNATGRAADTAELVVESGATAGTGVDHNLVSERGDGAYLWAGTRLPLDGFRTVTGQAGHDLTGDQKLRPDPSALFEGSAGIDSADPAAPGMLDTDAAGRNAVDDPKVANTGPQGTTRDRGAFEFQGLQDPMEVLVGPGQGPWPLPVEVSVRAADSWDTPLTYTYDFGDGSAPVVGTGTRVSHTYAAKGRYQVRVTATDGLGRRAAGRTASDGAYATVVDVRDPGPLVPDLKVQPGQDDFRFSFDASASTGPWAVTSYSFDFGDGSPVESGYGAIRSHLYGAAGSYTATVTVTDESGRTAQTSVKAEPRYAPAGFVAVTPTRIMDTRDPAAYKWMGPSPDPLKAGESRILSPGPPEIPAGATAIVVNVTATDASQDTHVDLYPLGGRPGGTSNVNVGPGQTVANLVTLPVTYRGGAFNVRNNSGSVHVVLDVYGYYLPGAADRFTPLAPSRLVDTRQGAGKVGAGATLPVRVAGVAGVPADASAVVLNLTATEPTEAGYLAARPGGAAGRPTTSSLNFRAGQTVPNQVIVPVGADGRVDVFNNAGATHVIADVAGYYSASGKGLFTPVAPVRLQDTRVSPGLPVGAYASTSVQVSGTAGVPADAVAGVFNLTATDPVSDGHVIAYPEGAAVPTASNLNFRAGQTVGNHAQVPLGVDGRLGLRNNSGGAHLITDLFGYFTNAG